MRKQKTNMAEFRRLNKISTLSIILFLVISINYYAELGDNEMSRKIAIGMGIFVILAFKNIISSAGGMSDGIDIGLN